MAWETEIESVENYYADLIIIQYRNKPKARATIKLGVDLYLADGLAFDLQNVLNIDTAQGAQLDLIGKILGCNRNIFGFNIDKKYFTFEKVDAYGFSDVNQLSEGLWKKYANSIGSAFALEDEDYRILLKFKALYNLRRGSWGDMDELYYRAFGDDVKIINTKDLSITYAVSNSASVAYRAAQFLGYIEPPLGIDYTTIMGENYLIWQTPVQNTGLGSHSWMAVASDNSKFVALGNTGYISISTDGTNWETAIQSVDLGNHSWTSLVYNGTNYIALGESGYLSTSTDGITWSAATQIGNLGSHFWVSIVCNNGLYIALGRTGFISTSTDGVTWSTATQIANLTDSSDWHTIAYGNNKYLALSTDYYISTSTDGTTWSAAAQNSDLSGHGWFSLIYNGEKFIALSYDGYIAASTDGTAWIVDNTDLGNHSWTSLTFNNGKNVAIGYSGYTSYTL